MGTWLRRAIDFLRAEDGPTAVEYAVMLALIVALCLPTAVALGYKLDRMISALALMMKYGS